MQASGGVVSLLDTLARFAMLAGIALFPVFIIPAPWAAVSHSKMLLLAGVLAVAALSWMAARMFEGVLRLPRGMLFFAVLLLPAAYIASAAITGFTGRSLVGSGIEQDTLAAIMLWFAAFALTAMLFSDYVAGVRAAVRALAAGTSALFAFQILYLLFPAAFDLGVLQGQTANLLGSWHDLGILAGLALGGAVLLFRSEIFAGPWRFLAFLLGILAAAMLVLVHFADVFWGAAALLAIAGALQAWRGMRDGFSLKNALGHALASLLIAIMLAAAAFGTPLWDAFPEKIRVIDTEVRPSWQGTLQVGKQSLDAPTQVLFGSGPNSFVRAWGMYKPEGVNLTPFWNADFTYGVGVIPTSIFSAGIVGLVAWAAIMLALLGLLFRAALEPRPLLVFLVLGSLYLLTFHMLYAPGVAISALAFLLMGLLAAWVTGGRPRLLEPRSLRSSVAFALIILAAVPVVGATALTGREVASNLFVNRAAVLYQAAGDTAGAARSLGASIVISPRNDRAHRAAAELGLVELAQLLAQGVETEESRALLQETLQATIQHGLTAVEIDGENYQNWLLLAQVYGSLAGANVEGAYEEARETYERAAQANPTNPLPKLRLAQLAAARGDLAAARAALDEALTLKQDFAAAYFLRSQVDAAEGDLPAAAEAGAAAVQLVPDDPLGWFNLGRILYAAGDFTNAASVLEQAVGRANDYSDALFYLSASYYQLGRIEDAASALQRVVALNPELAWVQEALGTLLGGGDPFTPAAQ